MSTLFKIESTLPKGYALFKDYLFELEKYNSFL